MDKKILTAILLLSVAYLHGSEGIQLGPNNTPAEARRLFVAGYNQQNATKINATDVEIVFKDINISKRKETLGQLGVQSERDLFFGVPLGYKKTKVWVTSLNKNPW
jgi:hypothetical protein